MKQELQDKILAAYRKEGEENGYGFPWSEATFGSDARRLYVFERSNRPGTVRVRWQATDAEAAERDGTTRPKRTLQLQEAIRDKRGRFRKRGLDRARAAAKEVYEEWLDPSSADDATGHATTLEDVFRRLLDPKDGKSVTDRWAYRLGSFPIKHDRRTHLSIIAQAIGLGVRPKDITMKHARRIWRAVADHHGQSGVGYRAAEQTVATLVSALNYARREGIIPPTAGVLPGGWHEDLKIDWIARTETNPNDVKRETYTEQETAQIIGALPKADPRIRLPIHLGAGFRLGQVATYLKRSGIHEGGTFGLYAEFIDRKSGETVRIDLPPPAQRTLRRAWSSGHLRRLEAAYQDGELEDYFIVPGGLMKDGACQVEHAGAPLDRRYVLRLFHRLEKAAGVEHIRGRAFHGLRRAFEPLVARHSPDSRVRDKAGGWKIGSGTREAIYTKSDSEALAAATAVARAAALEDVSNPASPAERAEDLSVQARLTLTELASVAELAGGGLGDEVSELIEGVKRIEERARELAAEAENVETVLTTEDAEAARHRELAAGIQAELDRQGLTQKAAAELAGVSASDISYIVRGKAGGVVSTERVEHVLQALQASPETRA